EGVEPMRVPRRDRVEPADAPRAPGGRSVLVGHLAQRIAFAAMHLGEERALTDRGGVRLHYTDDPCDETRRYPGADGRTAGERVRRRDVRIDAPVEVTHHAELSLQEDAGVGADRALHQRERVHDPLAKGRNVAQHLVGDALGVEGRIAKTLDDLVLRLE